MISKLFTVAAVSCVVASVAATTGYEDYWYRHKDVVAIRAACEAGLMSDCDKPGYEDFESIEEKLPWAPMRPFDGTEEQQALIGTGFKECFVIASQEIVSACCEVCELSLENFLDDDNGYNQTERESYFYSACRVQYGCDTIYNAEKLCVAGDAASGEEYLNCMTTTVAYSKQMAAYWNHVDADDYYGEA